MTCGVLKIPDGVISYFSITKPAIISQLLVPLFFYFNHSCRPPLCQALCYELGLWIWSHGVLVFKELLRWLVEEVAHIEALKNHSTKSHTQGQLQNTC